MPCQGEAAGAPCSPLRQVQPTLEALQSAAKAAALGRLQSSADMNGVALDMGCALPVQSSTSFHEEAADIGLSIGRALRSALLDVASHHYHSKTQHQQEEGLKDDHAPVEGRASAANGVLPTSHTYSQHRELIHGTHWSAQAAGILCACARKTHTHEDIPVYFLCNLEPYGPTRALQAGLLKVSWPSLGVKPESALCGEHQGTGTLLCQHTPGKPQAAYHVAALAVHLTGLQCEQKDAEHTAVAGGDRSESSINDMLAPGENHAAPAALQRSKGHRRTRAKQLQPPFKVTVQLVSAAVSSLLQQLKVKSTGGFGITCLEAKLQSLLPTVGNALMSIIRSAHSPVLLPFSCSSLNCTTSTLEASMHAALQHACTGALAGKVSHRQNQGDAAATGADDGTRADDASLAKHDADASTATVAMPVSNDISHELLCAMPETGADSGAALTVAGSSFDQLPMTCASSVEDGPWMGQAAQPHPELHAGFQAALKGRPGTAMQEALQLQPRVLTEADNCQPGHACVARNEEQDRSTPATYSTCLTQTGTATAEPPMLEPTMHVATERSCGKLQAARDPDLHNAIQRLYGIKPSKKQCLTVDSSQWLF